MELCAYFLLPLTTLEKLQRGLMSYKCTTHSTRTTHSVTKYSTVLQEVKLEYHSWALNTL